MLLWKAIFHIPALTSPETTENWFKANRSLQQQVVPRVLAKVNLDMKNKMLCDGIYKVFATVVGTTSNQASFHYKPHNRELKQLRKLKNISQKALQAAKRKQKNSEEVKSWALSTAGNTIKFWRKHTSIKGILMWALSYQKRVCTFFWNFANKILDDDGKTPLLLLTAITPSFDSSVAMAYSNKLTHSS